MILENKKIVHNEITAKNKEQLKRALELLLLEVDNDASGIMFGYTLYVRYPRDCRNLEQEERVLAKLIEVLNSNQQQLIESV
jgi:hypothetical protein